MYKLFLLCIPHHHMSQAPYNYSMHPVPHLTTDDDSCTTTKTSWFSPNFGSFLKHLVIIIPQLASEFH